jgi:hypothetical protein
MLPKMPKFETEAQEAEWWYEQRHNIAAEFERVKPKPGPSRVLQELAKRRGITFDELLQQMRSRSSEEDNPAELPRSA